MPINQPSNKIKLTNVSIVRLKKGGNRFEIACYKNKVQQWRTGIETNLDDVLQVSAVYKNASKGDQAKDNDLKKAFGTTDKEAIIKEILKNGELQVGDKERENDIHNRRLEIANGIAQMVVNPDTQIPYSIAIIINAMNDAGFSVELSKNVKSQTLSCIKLLQQKSSLRIQRARMRVRVSIPTTEHEDARERIRKLADIVEGDEVHEETWEAILLIDPSQFRVIEDLLKKELKEGDVSILDHTVMAVPPTPDT